MINYLSKEEIIEINKYSLELTGEENEFYVIQPDDLTFIIDFVKEEYNKDLLKKAVVYCVSLIVMHPFKNGNHRTSLLSAERFLLKNKYILLTSNKEKIEIEKWRIKYEEEKDLERSFFQIACIENNKQRKAKIKKVINSEYGIKIEKWLRENYKKLI
jgi:death-on-curing family protein